MSSDTLLKIAYIYFVVNYLELCTKDTNGCVVSLNAEQCEHYAKSSSTSATWNRVFITPTTAGRDNYPKGCFHNFNNQIYFNPHVTGAAKDKRKPICIKCSGNIQFCADFCIDHTQNLTQHHITTKTIYSTSYMFHFHFLESRIFSSIAVNWRSRRTLAHSCD